jgi:hypothetical protein
MMINRECKDNNDDEEEEDEDGDNVTIKTS